mgnify:CR=1 FL=1
MFPLAQPGIITVGIFIFMNIWNEYFISMVFASNSEVMPVGPGLKTVLTSMQYTGDWGGLFAAVVIVFLPTLLLYISCRRRSFPVLPAVVSRVDYGVKTAVRKG